MAVRLSPIQRIVEVGWPSVGDLFVCGDFNRWNDDATLATLVQYNKATNTWAKRTNGLSGSPCSFAVFNNRLYVITSLRIQYYDPATQQWVNTAITTSSGGDFFSYCLCVLGNELYAFSPFQFSGQSGGSSYVIKTSDGANWSAVSGHGITNGARRSRAGTGCIYYSGSNGSAQIFGKYDGVTWNTSQWTLSSATKITWFAESSLGGVLVTATSTLNWNNGPLIDPGGTFGPQNPEGCAFLWNPTGDAIDVCVGGFNDYANGPNTEYQQRMATTSFGYCIEDVPGAAGRAIFGTGGSSPPRHDIITLFPLNVIPEDGNVVWELSVDDTFSSNQGYCSGEVYCMEWYGDTLLIGGTHTGIGYNRPTATCLSTGQLRGFSAFDGSTHAKAFNSTGSLNGSGGVRGMIHIRKDAGNLT